MGIGSVGMLANVEMSVTRRFRSHLATDHWSRRDQGAATGGFPPSCVMLTKKAEEVGRTGKYQASAGHHLGAVGTPNVEGWEIYQCNIW